MTTIGHICAGHEYRYDTESGAVTNNYGTQKAVLLFARFIPSNYAAVAILWREAPKCAADRPLAVLKCDRMPTDAQLAQFAIRQTAAHFPEAR